MASTTWLIFLFLAIRRQTRALRPDWVNTFCYQPDLVSLIDIRKQGG
ncbi:hypothetical protein [Laspinema olomoucense]|nr:MULTISPECIES: hypothetical protein [unclassified Laspinema]MCT7971653.1 hypothetical protein [Laspinema sp. D3d]MCT7992904.1 hypothetical protein [Laspinema sp. D3c]